MNESVLPIVSGSPAADIKEQLASFGLNLFALLDASKLQDRTFPPATTVVLVVGNYGRQMWDCLPAGWQQQSHPVDDFTSIVMQRVLTAVIGKSGWTLLFPDRSLAIAPVLQDLGRAAGWHNPSPLGNGIHPQHGLWFAYRSVVAIDIDIEVGDRSRLTARPVRSESPCVSCANQPCISACPPSALSLGAAPNLAACVNFRTSDQSPCAERCLARQKCPVGLQSRYADEQIQYFYRQSLRSLQRWVSEASVRDRTDP